jgi:hypothetical protein
MTTSARPVALGQVSTIGDADTRLAEWVASITPGAEVSYEPPAAAPAGKGVSLYLYELRPQPPPRTRMPPVQATLRYLVTAWAASQVDAHALLGDLILAALETADMEVDQEPVPLEVWRLFGTPPRPSFVLSVGLRRDRDEPPVSMVRQQMIVKTAELRPLRGVVVGPGDVPLAGARVEIPLANLATMTDRLGRFAFAAVAAGEYPARLRVLARNRELTLTADVHSNEPLVIHFEPLEG